MRKSILIGMILMVYSVAMYAQPANNDCLAPTAITLLDGSCTIADNTMATFDLANGDCAPSPTAPNVWFTFVAQGPDVDIAVNGQVNDVYVTLLQFDPTPCDFASAGQLDCGFATAGMDAINFSGLVIGQTYYLVVNLADGVGNPAEGILQVCVDNPVPVAGPPNDETCDAEVVAPNGTCTNGTTIAATNNFNSIPGCSIIPENDVFYEFTVSPGNLSVTIDLNNINLPGDVVVVLGEWNPDCNGSLVLATDAYCGPPTTDAITFQGVVPGNTYVVYIGTAAGDEGDFQLCVTESGPPPGCSENNTCDVAEFVNGMNSNNTAYTCVPGCNILASPEPGLTGCNFATEEVVWFTFTSDAAASLLTVTVNSVEIEAPSVQIFTGTCNGLVEQSTCVTGVGGNAEIVNNFIPSNATIFIAVSNGYGDGGEFDLCMLMLDDPSQCVLESGIEVTGTSLGSPLDGPYQPAEVVSFCYNIDSYTSASNVNGCQWLQGIIPIFGPAWDPSSFAGTGMPISNSGVNQPAYGSTWGWYTDVTYNTTLPPPNATKSVGDFDGDGIIDMCHFTEPDCPGTGIVAGQIMPPGWYAWNPADGGASGHPNVDWGSGSGCNGNQGPWSVCFDLTTLDFEGCDAEDPQITDTSIKVYTTSDGETGSWTGGVSVCADDIPTVKNSVLNCCIGPIVDPLMDVVCSGEVTNITLTADQSGDIQFSWVIDPPNNNVTGWSDGSGKFITQTLTNNTTTIQIVNYMVTAISEEGCFGLPSLVPVTVLPAIEVDAGAPIDGCAQGEFMLGGSPTAVGGDGNFTYDWGNSSLDNIANPTASPNITTTYTVTVTDANGCTSTDDVTLTINPRFDVEIDGDTLLCPDFPLTTINGSPLGGTPNYTFQWMGEGTNNSTNQVLDWDGNGLPSGDYTVTLEVTDDNGCTGDTEFIVDVFNEPQLFISSIPDGGQYCPGESIDISAAAVLGEPGVVYNFAWTTPNGNTLNGANIVANETGYYVLEVTDPIINCLKVDSIFIEEIASPEPEISAPQGLCEGEMVFISTTEDFETYEWENGSTEDSILVDPGTYFVTVTNSAGCSGVGAITVNPFPPTSASIGGSSTFCEGSSSILNVGSNFESYEWTNAAGDVISTADTALVQTPGTVSVTVFDTNGCSTNASVEVEIQDFLVPNVQGDTSLCPQACSDLDAGDGYAEYLWSNGDTVQVITVCDAGDYSVTVTDPGGCTGEQVKTITINPLPTATITGEGGKTSFCPGDDLLLDAGAGYISYLWEDNSTGQTFEVTQEGTYIVTVTDSEGCEGTAEIDILLDANPMPSFSGDQVFCPGDSVLITPEAGYDLYEVDVDNNGSVDITNMTNDPFYVNAVGNSNIIVTDSNGCEGEVLVDVSQFTPPSPVTTSDTASFCTNSSVFISLEDGYDQINWIVNGNSAGTDQTIEVDQEGVYEVVVTDANGCTGNTSMVVIESTQLFPSITGENQMCDNTPIELDAGQGYDTYDWGALGDTQVVTVSTDSTYTVTVYDAGGCSGTAQITVTNSDTPSASVAPSYFVCNNTNGDNESVVSFNSLVTGSNGFWTDTDGSGVNLADLNNVDFDGVLPGFYTFTYETSIAISPCEDQAYTMLVEVNECLCPSLELSDVDAVCQGDATLNLNDYKVTSEDGFWNVEDGEGAVLAGAIFDPVNATPGIYTLSFNLEDPKENCDSTETLQIEVIAPPNPGISVGPIVLCLNADEQVSLADLLDGEDADGAWSEISADPSLPGAFDANAGTFNTGNELAGTYTFRYDLIGTAPCTDDFSEVQVVIEPLPTAVAGDDKMLNCDLLEVEIGTNNSIGNNLSFNWTETKGISIDNANDPIVVVDEEGTYMLEVIDENSCSDLDSVIVTRNTDFPDLTLEGQDPFCQGENTGVILADGFGGQGPYQYSLDNGATWLDADAFLNLGAGTYTVQVQDQNLCTGEEVITIVDPEAFTIDLGGDLLLQNVADTLISLDVSTGIQNLEAAIWTVDGSIVCEGPECLTYQVELTSNKEVCVFATSSDGCVDSTCINIRVVKVNNAYTGNAFTPDDDGVNDIFFIQGGEDLMEVNFFRIYDRWGEQVFGLESFPPNDPEFGWDGRFKDGSVQQGVYVYVAEIVFENGDVELIQGDVTIYR